MFNKKRIFLILILIIIIGTISSVSASDSNQTTEITDKLTANDIDILNSQSTDTEVLSATHNTFTDLNNVINGNNDSEIYLNCNYTFDPNVDFDFKDGIVIGRAVTVWGNGYTLNGNHIARIFLPNNADIILHDIVFINGNATGEGWAINEEYDGGAVCGECTIVNCTFINNSAAGYGGAVSDGYCVNCTFIKNTAGNAGAVSGAECVNCTFTENSATYRAGAALSPGSGSIVNCIFVRNSANLEGGAIYYGGSRTTNIENCTFIENSANVGGAIYNFFSDVFTIVNCNFTRNSALWEAGAVHGAKCVNCSFTENYADYGGATYDVRAENCIFTGNYAIFGGASYESTSVDCTFIENYADYGGAIYLGSRTENCSFIKNFADFGGAIYTMLSIWSAVDCSFINNTARNGGATYEVNAENCYFKENKATENGGAMYGESATNCTFEDNNAKCCGNDTYNTIISDSSYDNNIIYFDASAAQDGDGSENNPYKYLYASRITPGVTAYFEDGTYSLNETCIITGVTKLIGKGSKVVIYSKVPNQYDFIIKEDAYLEFYRIRFINVNILNQATLMAKNTIFDGNEVFDLNNLPGIESGSGLFDSSYGGVIVCDTPSNVRSTLILDDCTFRNIYNAFNGGVIAAINSDISIKSVSFHYFSSTYKGGAIYCVNSNLNIYSSQFSPFSNTIYGNSNRDSDNEYSSYYGGSIYCEDCDMFIYLSKFKGSVSSSFGGCIASLNSHVTIERSDFNNSFSLNNGGGAIYSSKSELCIFDSILYGNSAEFGGAICNINSILDSYHTEYGYNDAKYYGGVIYDIYGTLDFYMNRFYVSHALVGGSIYTRIPNSFNLYSNSFGDSFAQEDASSIFIDGKKGGWEVSNSYANDYHLFAEFTATLNGKEYYLISNPLNYQLFSKEPSYLYTPFPIFDVNDGLVSIVIYDRDDASNLTSIATRNVVRKRSNGTYVYLGSRSGLFDGFKLIKTYRIDLSDKVINNNYDITESCAINFEKSIVSIKTDNLYEANSYYPVSLVNSSVMDSSSAPSSVGDLLSYYNSNDYGLISSVKDQKNGGNCWAFAGLATLEACLKKATGVDYDFSEENAKNLMAAYSVYGIKIETNYGGYDSMMMSYLTSWLGPINESAEVYDDYSTISILKNPMFHIQNIMFLPARSDSSDNDMYKLAIKDYGAVSVIFKWGKDYHAVSLVGWDDNYKGYDSIGNKANGAWIFKNSFGEDWENNGFGYLSYNQKISEQIDPSLHAYTFIFNDENPYEKIYQYDFAGVSQFYHYPDSIYFKNTFEAESDSLLSAFSTYFDAQTDYTVSVYVNDQFVFAQNGTNFIQLDKGDKFTIMVHNHNREGYSCIPLCYAEEITKKTFSENVSFVSLDGETWYDLYDYADSCHVACIKAFTQNINPKRIKINTNDIRTINTHNLNVKVSFDDFESIDSINYCLLKFVVDGKNYYAQIEDGFACFNIKLDDGIHTLFVQYKDNIYESNVIQFSFTVDTSKESNSFNAIQDLVDSSSNKSTIFLDRDYVYDEYFDDGDNGVIIYKQITINGNGHVIDGLNKATGFLVASNNVVLNDIVFVNMFGRNGGGVNVMAQNVTFNNCIFINSSADQYGGGIYSSFDITLNNCHFINDSANMGGGVYLRSAEASYIEKSFFDNNSAITHGSAIYIDGIGNVFVSSTNFTNNIANSNGGAVFSNAMVNEFVDCNFVNNSAVDSSGAISTHNTIYIHNSSFINNSAGNYGGVINSNGNVSIYSSSFINNSAGSLGGVIKSNGNVNFYTSSFINNSAQWGGSIISFGNISIDSCNFTKNHAVNSGGSIYSQGTCNVADSYFDENTANSAGAIFIEIEGFITNSRFVNNSASFVGGAVDSLGECSLSDSDFVDNYAKFGGAVCSYYGSDSTPDINISSCRFINNCANISGGAVYTDGKGIVEDSLFAENNATYGGAIFNFGNASIDACNFSKNCAIGIGGAINSQGTCHVGDSYFDENTANTGGAIVLEIEGFIANSILVSNSASEVGGAMVGANASNCTFISNYAGENGGAVYEASCVNCSFFSNSATYGGAISNGTADCCYFQNNTASSEGDDTYETEVIKPILNVSDFTSNYNSSDKLIINLINPSGALVNDADVTIDVYKKGKLVNTYCCLSGDGWVVDLVPGNYIAVVSANPGYLIDPVNAPVNATIKINKADTNLLATANNTELIATLTYSDTGKAIKGANIVININGEDYSLKTNSKGQVKLFTASSEYTVTISYAGNTKFNPSNTTIDRNNKINMIISAVYNAENKEIIATLINEATGKPVSNANVKVNFNGESTTAKTNNKGHAIISTEGLPNGPYTATFSYKGNSKYNPASASISFDVKTKVIITDVYGYQDKLVATLTNGATGNPIVNAYMQVKINGVTYTAKSNSKSQISIDTSDLGLTEYDVTISYGGNSRYTPSSATVAIDLNKANMNIKYSYNADTNELVATLKNSKTGKVISNANMVVDITTRDKLYSQQQTLHRELM